MLLIQTILFLISWFIGGLTIHELGHILAFKAYGFKDPSVRITKLGTVIVGENVYKDITLGQSLVISIAGILAGLPFFLSIPTIGAWGYLGLCSFDIISIGSLIFVYVSDFRVSFDDKIGDLILMELRDDINKKGWGII